MLKKKLLMSCLAGGLLAESVFVSIPVRAEDLMNEISIVQEESEEHSVSYAVEDTETTPETGNKASNQPEEDPENPLENKDTELPKEDTGSESESQEEGTEEKTEPQIHVSSQELYQGEETELEVDGLNEDDTSDILYELLTLTIPQGLITTRLTVPVFEDSEITVWIDGEEVTTEEQVTDIGRAAEKIEVSVKPIGNILTQVQKMVLHMVNGSSEQSEVRFESVLERFFKDGSQMQTNLDSVSILLKGILPVDDPEIQPEPSEPSEGEEIPAIPEEQTEETDESKEETVVPVLPSKDETKAEPTVIYEIVDYSGLNLMEANASASDNRWLLFLDEREADEHESGIEFFQKKKIETASVDDASQEISVTENRTDNSSSKENDNGLDPVTRQEKEMGIQTEEKSNPVLPILLAVAAAAGAFVFVPLAKKRTRDSENKNSGTE